MYFYEKAGGGIKARRGQERTLRCRVARKQYIKVLPHVKWLKCEMQPGGPTLKKGESFSNPAGRIFYNFNQKIEMIL